MARRSSALVLSVVVVLAGVLLTAVPARAAAATRVLIVGDSITQGSAGDFTWRYRLWKHLAATAPGAADFVGDRTYLYDNIAEQQGSMAYADPNFDTAHHALWGRPLAFEKDTVASAVSSSGAQVVLVLLGINDLAWFGETPAQVAADMDTFIRNVRSANPAAKIVIGHVLSRYDIFGQKLVNVNDTQDLNARYDALAAARSTASSRVVTAATDAGWDPRVDTWDGTHPNSTGEVRIAAKFADALHGLGLGAAYGSIPSSVQWTSTGAKPSAVSGDRKVTLSWAARPGANAYFIEQKIDSIGQTAFTRLPYAVSATSWTAGLLLAGWVVEFRVVPVKGLMTGLPGPAVTTTVGGVRPTDRPQLYGTPGTVSNQVTLLWTGVANTTGYYIEQLDLADPNPTWQRLPLPVPDTAFNPGLLATGHWYRFRVVPVNGLLTGPASNTVDVRTIGLPLYNAFYALGDSYSSGLGTLGTAGSYSGGSCKRSSQAWAYLAQAPWDPPPNLLACAGAKTDDLLANQLPQVPVMWGPILITLTIGGNDVGFADEAGKCWKTDCTGDEATLNARIDGVGGTLRNTYTAIKNRAPGADIVVAGYPRLITDPAFANCSTAFGSGIIGISDGFHDNEKAMIRRLADRLNFVIQSAADDVGVVAAVSDVVSWFDGHEACAGPSNGEYINQIAECDISFSCSGTLHPNYGGQLAYAFAVNQRRQALGALGYVRY
jgi:lysophospholipase L1-like esterase